MFQNLKKFASHNRIFLSRVLVLIVLIFWLFTESYWKNKYPIFASFLFLVGTFLVGIAGNG